MSAIGTQLRDPITSGLTRWRVVWVLTLKKVRNSDSGATCGRHTGDRLTYCRYMEVRMTYGRQRARMIYGSQTGTGTGPPSTHGQPGKGSDGRSGVWMESGLRGEEIRVKSERCRDVNL